LAPETLSDTIVGSGKAYFCQKADMFSLGLILYEMITAIQMPQTGELFQAFRSNNIPKLRLEAWQGEFCFSISSYETKELLRPLKIQMLRNWS
jgi:serine/threonine protein kinase